MKNLKIFEKEGIVLDFNSQLKITGGDTCTGGGFKQSPLRNGTGVEVTTWEGDCELDNGATVYHNSKTYTYNYQ